MNNSRGDIKGKLKKHKYNKRDQTIIRESLCTICHGKGGTWLSPGPFWVKCPRGCKKTK